MKKFFVSLVVAMMATTASFAQSSLLATLSHDGSISAFYGANALKSALAAAESGDVITLSSGQFNAADITKPVTLRGAGMFISTDSINAHESTIILNNFNINISDSLSGRLLMEGLYLKGGVTYAGSINNAQFQKCRFSYIYDNKQVTTKLVNTAFIHCRIRNEFRCSANSSVYFINCAVCSPSNFYESSNIEFTNCFVKYDFYSSYGKYPSQVINANYRNCILQPTYFDDYRWIPSSCVATNCISVFNTSSSYYRIFNNMISNITTNEYVSAPSSLFEYYSTTGGDTYIQDHYDFHLTDDAAKTYLGNDGTQIGIYGGNLPYEEDPTIPQITKCNVAAKSTADGKLSVDIEVKAAEY